MKKALPETGGITTQVEGFMEKEAKLFRDRVESATDNCVIAGKKYYVSQNGNDKFDGTAPEKAVRTISRIAQFIDVLKPGDGVLFERGSVFRTTVDFNLVDGVTYAAYGQGDKPQIYGSYKNYADKSIWVPTEIENVWKIAYFPHTDAGILVFDGGKETGKKQLTVEELTEENDYCHDWDNDILYLFCSRGNPGEVFSEIEIGTKIRLFHMPASAHDIVIDNISFAYTGLFGIRADSLAKNITITNCKFSWIGGSLFNNKSNRFGNGIEFAFGCDGIVVNNCSFDQIFDSGVTFQIGSSPYRNFVVSECIFENNGMSGFEWWVSGDQGEKDGIPIDITEIKNIIIEKNLFRLTGFGWSKAVRSPAHIRNGWRQKLYTNIENFIIRNNIFDYANGPIIASSWETAPNGYTVYDNAYYQRSIEMQEENAIYHPFRQINEKKINVSNYEEFASAVKEVDKSPQKIEWFSEY